MSSTAQRSVSAPALLAVLVPAMLLTVVAADMVSLVLPDIRAEFGVSEARLAWVVTGFLLVFSVGVPFYGRLSDRVRLRRLFTVVLLVYATGALACALAPSFAALLVGRVVMGAGAAAVPVLAIVAVTRLLPGHRRATGIGFVGAAGGIGTAAGPAVGGGVGGLLGWQSLFWLMLVLALALVPGVLRLLPDDTPGDDRAFDVLGGVLLGVAAGSLLFGVTQGQAAGFASPSSWGCLAVAVGAGALVGVRTRVAREPFVPPALLRSPAFLAAIVTVALAMVVNIGMLTFVPLLIVDVDGLSAGEGSLVMIPGGIALAVLSPLAGRWAGRTGPRTPVTAGLLVMAASTASLSTFADASPILAGVAVLGLGAGFAFVITNVTTFAATSLPHDKAGVGIGIFQCAQFLGAGTGPALLGTLVAARHGSEHAANPLYAFDAVPYSDAFLALTVVSLLAIAAARRLRPARPS